MSLHRLILAYSAVLTAFLVPAQAAEYQRYQNGACAAGSICNIDFPNVPAGKVLTISNLSCYLRLPSTSDLYGAQLLLIQNSTGAVVFALTASLFRQNTVRISPTVDEETWVSNDAIRAVARPGQHFRAYAEARSSSSGAIATISQYACHISGTLTP